MKPPIDVIHLFPVLNDRLIQLLKNLSEEDWKRKTVARKWDVKDVTAHLLDGNFRRIALHRDNYFVQPEWPVKDFQDLIDFLNGMNADWVRACKRLSPAILIELLQQTNTEVYRIFKDLDPFKRAAYPVSWAGHEISENWFDIAREYTERWLHQQQIRDAVSDNLLISDELYNPFLHIFMQALPYTFQHIRAEDATSIRVSVTGQGGGDWYLLYTNSKWELSTKPGRQPDAHTVIQGDIAWKLFSRSLRPEDLNGEIELKGNRELAERVLHMVSVMA